MKALKRTVPLVVSIFTLSLISPLAISQDVNNRTNIYGGISRFLLDGKHNQENDNGWQIGGELPISERWSTTLEHWGVKSYINSSSDESNISYNRIGANYHLNMTDFWQPYLALGLGELNINPGIASDMTDTALDFGIGVKGSFSENFFLRGDIKALISDNSTHDFLAGLSLGYAFGHDSSAPISKPIQAPKDSDGDGLFDEQDSCRNTPRGTSVDRRGCEIDSDRDDVVDSRDECPATATNVAVDSRGCPISDAVEFRQTLLFNFDTKQAVVKEQYSDEIIDFANFMKAYNNSTAVIEGHTDSDGEENYNQALSQRRAVAVMDKLIRLGIESSRLSAIGYGEIRPVDTNSTAAGKANNRRIEAIITAKE